MAESDHGANPRSFRDAQRSFNRLSVVQDGRGSSRRPRTVHGAGKSVRWLITVNAAGAVPVKSGPRPRGAVLTCAGGEVYAGFGVRRMARGQRVGLRLPVEVF